MFWLPRRLLNVCGGSWYMFWLCRASWNVGTLKITCRSSTMPFLRLFRDCGSLADVSVCVESARFVHDREIKICARPPSARVWVYLLPCSVCMCTRLRCISCGRPRWMGIPKGVFNPLYPMCMRKINTWLREKQGKEWRFCTRLVALYFVN